jgi:hypothetical protein
MTATAGGALDAVLPLLLADRSPALRLRALTEVGGVPRGDPEVRELAAAVPGSPEAAAALAAAGASADPRSLSWALCRLAHLGLDAGHPPVREIAERLFARQRPDGSWPLPAATQPGAVRPGADKPDAGPDRPAPGQPAAIAPTGERYQMIPLQTAIPLRGLAAVGLGTDPRAERAYEWLLARRLDDGSWPTGVASGQRGYVAGYRRLPRSEGCRANTTGALACLAHHPQRRASEPARRALDLLLGRETRDEWTIGYDIARLLGAEPVRGFITFYARFDLVVLLDLAARCGATPDDPRVGDLVAFLRSLRGPYGLWDHPAHPQLSRWLTLDLLSSLARLARGDWTGTDLRVRFRAYPKRPRRY